MAADDRRLLRVRLSDHAHAGLDALAYRHHVTVTAMVEALGQLGRSAEPDWGEVFEMAREIDRQRRSRR